MLLLWRKEECSFGWLQHKGTGVNTGGLIVCQVRDVTKYFTRYLKGLATDQEIGKKRAYFMEKVETVKNKIVVVEKITARSGNTHLRGRET